MLMPEKETASQEAENKGSITDKLWRFFSSTRLALVLILVLTGLSLIGALVIQAPSGIIADKLSYQYWLQEAANPKYGPWAPLLSLLSVFDMFHSPWFLGAGVLLVINILICSLNRWRSLRNAMYGGTVKLADAFYITGNIKGELSTANKSPQEAITRVLKRRGYRVRVEQYENKTYIAADKNGILRLSTFVSHLSLILFIIAFLIGSYFGFRDQGFVVAEDSQQEVGHNTGLSLYLDSFVDEYYPDGAPKDYRSQVKLFENGTQVKSAIIRVNYPLMYKGVRFYQAFFGPAVKLEVKRQGQVIFNVNVPMTKTIDIDTARRYTGDFELPQVGLTGRLISTAFNEPDPMIGPDEIGVQLSRAGQPIDLQKVTLGIPTDIQGLEFTYIGDAKYSGYQISRDPGNMLIWIASILFIFGISAVLYFPYKQVWALVQPKNRGFHINSRASSPRSFNPSGELNTLMSDIASELGKNKP
jgi:cytochrome c biogenesis protein